MSRLVFVCLVLLLAVPAFAGAGPRAPGDGTLEVQNGRGLVIVQGNGGILGRFDSGRMVIEDPIGNDGTGPVVFGAERIRELGARRTLYIGEDVRFRLIGGTYRIRVNAVGIWLSAAGRGVATLDDGEPSFSDPGRFSVNGAAFQAMPATPTKVVFGAAALDRPNLFGGTPGK